MATRTARQTPVGARPNKRREAVLFDQDAAGRLLEGMGDHAPRGMTIRSFSLRQNPAYRPGFSLSPLAALLLVTAPVACVRRVPETVLAGAPAAPAPVVARPARWAPKPTGTAADYVVEVDGALTIDDAAGPSRDSTALRLTASVRRAAGTGFSGVVRAVTVRSPGMNTPVALPRIPLPAPYSANASIGVCRPRRRLAWRPRIPVTEILASP